VTRVAVSIVSTGERERIGSCLRSLVGQEFDGSLAVVVVVNGPDDGTVAVTTSLFPDARIIRHDAPRGFAANHDTALDSVDFDFGLVLNPDVVLESDCIEELIAAMNRHPTAGIVAPLLSYPSGEPQPSARRFPRWAGTIARRTPLRRVFPRNIAGSRHFMAPPDGDRSIDWALGACLFVREAAWREVDGFDPEFAPLYVEDVDLAWRMWRAGWEVWQTPLARADHEHQAATDKVFFDRRTLWHARGMLRFVRKHPRILLSGARPGAGARELSL
jgi:GT2 family glycosyltransferase